MIRMLAVSAAVSVASLAFACPNDSATSTTTQVAHKTEGGTCCSAAAAVATVSEQKTCEKACATACSSAAVTAVAAAGDKTCSSSCKGDTAEASTTSLVSAMPRMTYRVNGKDTCCPKTAGEMAASPADIHYVVAGAEYDTRAEAIEAHSAQLQRFMMDLVRIQYAVDGECVACPDAAKKMAAACESKKVQYKVGPAVFDTAEQAVAASVMAYNAAQKVNMEYAVGEQTVTCSIKATEMADKAHCSVEFVINGQRTKCSKEAGYLKSIASVESALKALEAAAAGA